MPTHKKFRNSVFTDFEVECGWLTLPWLLSDLGKNLLSLIFSGPWRNICLPLTWVKIGFSLTYYILFSRFSSDFSLAKKNNTVFPGLLPHHGEPRIVGKKINIKRICRLTLFVSCVFYCVHLHTIYIYVTARISRTELCASRSKLCWVYYPVYTNINIYKYRVVYSA